MRIASFVRIAQTLLIAVAFAGGASCGDSTLDKIESAKDKVCACKDKKCAIKVMKENDGLRDKVKDMTNEDKLKAMKFVEQAKACASKL